MEYEDEDEEAPTPEGASDFMDLVVLILGSFPSLLPECLLELLALSSFAAKDNDMQTRIFHIIAR